MDPDGNQRHFLNSSRNSCAVSVLRAETRAATQACREAEGGGGGDSPCSLAASSRGRCSLDGALQLGLLTTATAMAEESDAEEKREEEETPGFHSRPAER